MENKLTAEKIKVYTGTKPCGCLVAVMIRGMETEQTELECWKMAGYIIEEMDIEEAQHKLKICKHKIT